MDLDKWMSLHNYVDEDVANAAGITRSYFTRIRNGKIDVSLRTALKIWDVTKRQVDLYQLLRTTERPGFVAPSIARRRPARRASRAPAAV